MYKHILFATELGEESRQVEDKVSSIVKLTGARVSIIHVVEPMPSAYVVGEVGPYYDTHEEQKKVNENALKALSPSVERLGVAITDVIVGSGRVATEVLLYAQQNDVDLLIVGSHGRHGFQLILGSTANAILHRAKCDVLAVRFSA